LQKTVQKFSSKFSDLSNVEYFLNQINTIASHNYLPTETDILRCRESTLGLLEATVTISGTHLRFLCMRGSKGQRRKWLPSFGAGEEHIAAVMFVASLDEYDQYHPNHNLKEEIVSTHLFIDCPDSIVQTILDYVEEDSKLKDAIDFFGEICENKFYENVGLILLLNRRNIFLEKLKSSPLSYHFHGFHEGNPAQYIENLFKEKNKNSARRIYSFLTDAVDKADVSNIMKEILQIFHSK